MTKEDSECYGFNYLNVFPFYLLLMPRKSEQKYKKKIDSLVQMSDIQKLIKKLLTMSCLFVRHYASRGITSTKLNIFIGTIYLYVSMSW